MIRQIAHLCIKTNILKKTLAFYQNGLGFKVQFKFIRKGKVFGYYLSCGKRTFIEIFRDKAAKKGLEGLIKHFCFEVSSLRDIQKRLDRKRIRHTDPKRGADNSWQLWIKDPNGINMEFHQYTQRSSQLTKRDCIVTW
jgi:lactoylglutathione lyase/glyoxylase I family protein